MPIAKLKRKVLVDDEAAVEEVVEQSTVSKEPNGLSER